MDGEVLTYSLLAGLTTVSTLRTGELEGETVLIISVLELGLLISLISVTVFLIGLLISLTSVTVSLEGLLTSLTSVTEFLKLSFLKLSFLKLSFLKLSFLNDDSRTGFEVLSLISVFTNLEGDEVVVVENLEVDGDTGEFANLDGDLTSVVVRVSGEFANLEGDLTTSVTVLAGE